MAGRADAEKRLLPVKPGAVTAAVEIALHQGKIQPALFQGLQKALGVIYRQGKRGLRLGAQKALDVRGNHIFANGFGRPHPQAHGGRGGHGGLGLLAVVRHRAGELPQARPGRRQPQGFAFIGEKAAAIVRL